MKKSIALVLVFLLSVMMFSGTAEVASIDARIVQIDACGEAKLDITEPDFTAAGFDLGDIVTVSFGGFTGDMPVFNGYYTDRGEFMLRVNPYEADIKLSVNYGNFSELTGSKAGDAVTIVMKEKRRRPGDPGNQQSFLQ